MKPDDCPAWVQAMHQRGLTPIIEVVLDVLEPFGMLAAQGLFVMQPFAAWFNQREMLGDVAEALQDPHQLDQLRQWLQDN